MYPLLGSVTTQHVGKKDSTGQLACIAMSSTPYYPTGQTCKHFHTQNTTHCCGANTVTSAS
jgi:hypothetical protein